MRVRLGSAAWLAAVAAALLLALALLDRPSEPEAAIPARAEPRRDADRHAAGAAAPDSARSGPSASSDAGRAVESEAELMRAATAALDYAPARTLELIAAADRAYGPRSEPRRELEIEAHVRLGRVGHARSLADRFYRAYPGSSAIARIERLTGYHPRPYGPPR